MATKFKSTKLSTTSIAGTQPNHRKTTMPTTQHMLTGITPTQLTRVHPEDEDTPILSTPFDFAWNSAWLIKSNTISIPNSKQTIDKYLQRKAPQRKRPERPLPLPHPKPAVGTPHTPPTPPYPSTQILPSSHYQITYHPANSIDALIHAPDGRLISTMTKLYSKI